LNRAATLDAMTEKRPAVSELTEEQLAAWLRKHGEPPYRAKQVRRHATHGTERGFAELTDLPKSLRDALAESFRWSSVEPVREEASADGETRKALLELRDGHHIESVLMPHHGARNAVCVSTQAGCPMACAFCATGEMGLVRNLSAGEIVDQIRHWQRELAERRERVSHVVYMGMGEPFNNYEATLASVRSLIDPEKFGISPRRLTISTCGVVPGIDALAGEGLPINLAVSLHAPDDPTRSRIMPINRKWGVEEVLAAAARYVKRTKRRVTFEYVLLAGVNDSVETARSLAAAIARHGPNKDAHVNLIPYNPGAGGFRRPSVERMEAFTKVLQDQGIAATLRISKGQDIAAGCGQLKVAEGKAAASA
jgi:23S rRNA (adenine2503-C2)-methyltransferase